MLKDSPWARFAEWGARWVELPSLNARYSDLFRAALEEQGTLCIGIYRLLEEEEDTEDQVLLSIPPSPRQTRVVLSCPENTMGLQPGDHIMALVQWRAEDKEKRE